MLKKGNAWRFSHFRPAVSFYIKFIVFDNEIVLFYFFIVLLFFSPYSRVTSSPSFGVQLCTKCMLRYSQQTWLFRVELTTRVCWFKGKTAQGWVKVSYKNIFWPPAKTRIWESISKSAANVCRKRSLGLLGIQAKCCILKWLDRYFLKLYTPRAWFVRPSWAKI